MWLLLLLKIPACLMTNAADMLVWNPCQVPWAGARKAELCTVATGQLRWHGECFLSFLDLSELKADLREL